MDLERRTVLVTGGAGFIGSHVVDLLLKGGSHVVVLDNLSSGRLENVQAHAGSRDFRFIRGDVRDGSAVAEAVRGADVVFHLAVDCLRASIREPAVNHEVNATGTLNLCLACRENGVKRLVYVSSSEVYGSGVRIPMGEDHPLQPTTVYGAGKAAGEMYTLAFHRTYGLAAMVVRPFNAYGPRSHFEGVYGEAIPKFLIRLLNRQAPVVFGDGRQTRDFTYVTDTARGIVEAARCDGMVGETVNVARGREVSVNDLAAMLARRVGADSIRPRHVEARPGDVLRHFADTTKAGERFGFRAEIDLEAGLDLYVRWFESQRFDVAALFKQDRERNW